MSCWERALRTLVVSAFCLPAEAQDDKNRRFDQFWPETDVFVKVNDSSRLFVFWAGTRTEEEGYTDGQVISLF